MVSMNRLSGEKRAAVVASLVEGNSIRSTVRMTGVTDHVWKLSEIIDLLEQAETAMPRKRGPYNKREAA